MGVRTSASLSARWRDESGPSSATGVLAGTAARFATDHSEIRPVDVEQRAPGRRVPVSASTRARGVADTASFAHGAARAVTLKDAPSC